jgi:hypothetical protein
MRSHSAPISNVSWLFKLLSEYHPGNHPGFNFKAKHLVLLLVHSSYILYFGLLLEVQTSIEKSNSDWGPCMGTPCLYGYQHGRLNGHLNTRHTSEFLKTNPSKVS